MLSFNGFLALSTCIEICLHMAVYAGYLTYFNLVQGETANHHQVEAIVSQANCNLGTGDQIFSDLEKIIGLKAEPSESSAEGLVMRKSLFGKQNIQAVHKGLAEDT